MTATASKQPMGFGEAAEAARKTLRLLASKRMAPTPDNYRQFYFEIVGEPEQGAVPLPVTEPSLAWGVLIGDLIQQCELRHQGWTAARKRERLERVLGSGNPTLLYNRLKALVENWSSSAPDTSAIESATFSAQENKRHDADSVDSPAALPASAEPTASLREWLVHSLETLVSTQLSGQEALVAESHALCSRIRRIDSDQNLPILAEDLRRFWAKVSRCTRDDNGLRDGVLRLLRLLIDNITELVVDDRWMQGQMDVVRRVLTDPSDIQLLEDAERSIKAVISKQGALKSSLSEAKTTLKEMVSHFIDHLGSMSQSTGAYQDKLGSYSKVISETDDIAELSSLLDDLIRETRHIQDETARTRQHIIAAHARAEAAERKVRQLEAELVQASELVREDQLTGVLNRRGLEDAFQRELSRAERNDGTLSIALLDLDNFKRLNDTHGHQAGDRALIHMVNLVKTTVRPHDIIARYGGEEFLILLPETSQDEASVVLVRLQRALTKHFFLHNNDRLLITFSAGVTQYRQGESRDDLVGRADAALYEAKKTGKNRVVQAP